MKIKQLTVVGAGTMGNGIAHTFAQHGFSVLLYDTATAQLDKALQTIAKNLNRQLQKGKISEALKSNAWVISKQLQKKNALFLKQISLLKQFQKIKPLKNKCLKTSKIGRASCRERV